MNKFVLCAMDRKNKTDEELRENYIDARASAASADYADYAANAANAAADAAANASAYAEYRLNKYFEITGENREDYQREIAKNG